MKLTDFLPIPSCFPTLDFSLAASIPHHSIKKVIPTGLAMSREIDLNDADYESRHVHQVYEKIATHFSSTRFKVGLLLSF